MRIINTVIQSAHSKMQLMKTLRTVILPYFDVFQATCLCVSAHHIT